MGYKKVHDLKTFLQIARIVFRGIEAKGKPTQRAYASNAIVQCELLEKTL